MSKPEPDITGRDRLARNLVARWLGQIVVVVSGFVIPRLIDDSLGPSSLGIWDLGWSTVAYFRLMGFGFAGGLNRFVALYNARGQQAELRRAVSSTCFLQLAIALATAVAALILAYFLPVLFSRIGESDMQSAQWLVAFLGGSLAVRMLYWPTRGILTGHHYWTVTSAVTAGGDIVVLAGLYLALKTGGGLATLGLVVFAVAFFTEAVRAFMAKRVYNDRMLIWSSVDKKMIAKMFVYGMKNNIGGLSVVIAVQTTGMLLAANAGPAALAVYARPVALFNHVERLITQYAFLLTPMAGSIQGLAREGELKEFFLTSMRSSLAMTLPAVLLLGGFGDAIIRLWMGESYVVPLLAPLLGVGLLLPLAHSAAFRILAGVNAHGRVAVITLFVTSAALLVSLIPAFMFGWSELVAAAVVGVSMTAGPGLTGVVGACRRFSVSMKEYLGQVVVAPVLCNLPLAAIIACSRIIDPQMKVGHAKIGHACVWGVLGMLVLGAMYWRLLFTAEMRAKWRRRFGARYRAATG